jgi:hypothetical protein
MTVSTYLGQFFADLDVQWLISMRICQTTQGIADPLSPLPNHSGIIIW